MRKKDIVKLVVVLIFTAVALFFCITGATVSQSIRAGEEQVDNGGEAIGYAFAAIFGILAALIFAAIAVVSDLISVIICLFGVRAPGKPSKITFWILFAANIVIGIVSVAAVFWGY